MIERNTVRYVYGDMLAMTYISVVIQNVPWGCDPNGVGPQHHNYKLSFPCINTL